jgi:hypothetical protein
MRYVLPARAAGCPMPPANGGVNAPTLRHGARQWALALRCEGLGMADNPMA